MSGVLEIQKWVWSQGAEGIDLLVLLCVAKHADWDTLECYPSQAYVAAQIGLSVRKVRSCLKDLEEKGIIRRVRRNTKDGRTSDIIALNAPDLLPPAGASDRAQRHETDSPAAYRVKTPAARGAGELSQTINQSEGTVARGRADSLFPDDRGLIAKVEAAATFLQAWNAYPLKGRERSSKKVSEPVWTALAAKHGGEALLNAVKRYAASPDAAKDGGMYAKAFHRWLRDHLWEAWLGPAPSAHGPTGEADWQ